MMTGDAPRNWRLVLGLKNMADQNRDLGDFTAQARAYAKARPGYPEDIVRKLLGRAGVRPGDCVVDIGAGTGLFTGLLSGRGFGVIAIEPNAAMRKEAPPVPGVRWRDGTFEVTGLPDNSADWVVAAQAFHWADPARALPEIDRILKPGKAFSILWNDRRMDRSELLMEIDAILRDSAPAFDERYRADTDWSRVLVQTGDFHGVQTDQTDHVVRMQAERFLDLWKSHNRLSVSVGPGGMRNLSARIADCLSRQGADWVDVHYTTRAWTAWSTKK